MEPEFIARYVDTGKVLLKFVPIASWVMNRLRQLKPLFALKTRENLGVS
jgi:hypothetical protein